MRINNGNEVLVVGDKILIRPKKEQQMTDSGLFLPPGVKEKEKIYSGYVVAVGPGMPIPHIKEDDEPWKVNETADDVKYIPLQIKIGDEVVYLQNAGYELELDKTKYTILSQHAVLLILRDNA
ncbi:MAG: co-chaperone GroES family protein, partial [Bacteroidota bacterium]|nr:co-chaperone GroES family protein [Bacteroidota bacterium]